MECRCRSCRSDARAIRKRDRGRRAGGPHRAETRPVTYPGRRHHEPRRWCRRRAGARTLQHPAAPHFPGDGDDEDHEAQEEQRLGDHHEGSEVVPGDTGEEPQAEDEPDGRQHDGEPRHPHRRASFGACAGAWHVKQDSSPDMSWERASGGWPSDLRNFWDSAWHSRQRALGKGWAILSGNA